MNYNIFLKDVKENNIKSSYLFYGEEEYLMNETLDLLKRQYIDSSLEALNFTIIEGKDTSLDTIINACETLPFMSSKKIVIVKDINTILENEGNGGESEFYQYLDNLGVYLLLILMGNNIKKSNRIYKYFNKQDRVVEFLNLKGKDLNM